MTVSIPAALNLINILIVCTMCEKKSKSVKYTGILYDALTDTVYFMEKFQSKKHFYKQSSFALGKCLGTLYICLRIRFH